MTIIRPSHSAMVHLGECVHSYETSGQAPRYTISASVITVEMTCASRQIPIEFDSTKVFPLPLIFNAFEKSFNRPRVCKQEPNSMMSLLTKEVPFVLTELWERVLEDVQSRIVIQLGLVILTSSKASAFDFFFCLVMIIRSLWKSDRGARHPDVVSQRHQVFGNATFCDMDEQRL